MPVHPPVDAAALLVALAEIAGRAHTEARLAPAVAEALAGLVDLRWVELGRCDRAAGTVVAWTCARGGSVAARSRRPSPGTLAAEALARPPRIVPVAEELDARSEMNRARSFGATSVALLGTGEDRYALLALGARGPAAVAPALLDPIARVIAALVRQMEVVGRVAAVSRRAHGDSRELYRELSRFVLPPEIVAASPAMRALLADVVPLVARERTAVLVTGETGTGKEVVARRIHALSGRASRPFVTLDCGALPEALADSALFGHERGAFTGATGRHAGVFERAHGGTLFLDEVGELCPAAQVKLLRALQEGEIERVGGGAPIRVDVRVIAATHRPLERMVEAGTFRADLFYRLHVFPVHVPPLRDRPEDLAPLAAAILERLAARAGRQPPAVPGEVMARLAAHGWPGNIRELESVLERALLLTRGPLLALPDRLDPAPRAAGDPGAAAGVPSFREAERRSIEAALAATRGRIYGAGGAAAALGLKPTTLQSKMKKLGVRRAASAHRPEKRANAPDT